MEICVDDVVLWAGNAETASESQYQLMNAEEQRFINLVLNHDLFGLITELQKMLKQTPKNADGIRLFCRSDKIQLTLVIWK